MTADGPAAAPAATVAPAARGLLLSLAITDVVILLDVLTKHWAVSTLAGEPPHHVVWTLQWNLAYNSGMAFSSGKGMGPVIGVLALAIGVAMLVAVRRQPSRLARVAAGLVAGGALGNVIDRLFRGDGWFRGSVVDFIDFQWFPIFNVADMAVNVGGALFVVWSLFSHEGDRQQADQAEGADVIREEIPAALAGERLDRVVALIAECSRSDAATLIALGGVTLEGAVETTGKLRLRAGQVVTVDPALLPEQTGPQPDPAVEFTVVHEDDDLIIVDKPAGLVVHPGAGNPRGTLVNGLLARYPEIADVGEAHRPGIVHRLDVGTSGLLAVARTQRAYHVLVDALATRDVGRVYRALVWGHLANPNGVVDAPIGRDHRDPMRMAVVVDGKPSRTRYRVLHEYRTPAEVSVLECRLESGRTHQIRVHLSAIGHPVVGDATYGGVRTHLSPPRPFLHAAELELHHPVSRAVLHFESPLPADLADVEAQLGN